jgi:plastocyanin
MRRPRVFAAATRSYASECGSDQSPDASDWLRPTYLLNMSISAQMHRVRFYTLAAALGLFALTAPPTHADDATTADIIQFGFEPAALQVAAGTTVTWTNHDAIIHSVTSGSPDAPEGAFDSGFFDQDGTFSFTFTDSGDYTYFCMRHNFMRGTVSVVPN